MLKQRWWKFIHLDPSLLSFAQPGHCSPGPSVALCPGTRGDLAPESMGCTELTHHRKWYGWYGQLWSGLVQEPLTTLSPWLAGLVVTCVNARELPDLHQPAPPPSPPPHQLYLEKQPDLSSPLPLDLDVACAGVPSAVLLE